ncbi:MAG: GNAT family N-acetyltransferase [Flavobacteriales bacterium]|nr:GNAT family N-acetyltransferase [Flavobacteriales bacterium]
MEEIKLMIKHFNELTVSEYHNLLALRTAIFVVEQDCPYQEVDDKDKVAYHVFGMYNNECVAVARILPQHISYPEISIGRIALAKNKRGTGIADDLMNQCFEFIEQNFGKQNIRISAQEYLLHFYNRHGFLQVSEMYLEDNIPHIEMLREA